MAYSEWPAPSEKEYDKFYTMLDLHTAIDNFVDMHETLQIDHSDLMALVLLLGRIRRAL